MRDVRPVLQSTSPLGRVGVRGLLELGRESERRGFATVRRWRKDAQRQLA